MALSLPFFWLVVLSALFFSISDILLSFNQKQIKVEEENAELFIDSISFDSNIEIDSLLVLFDPKGLQGIGLNDKQALRQMRSFLDSVDDSLTFGFPFSEFEEDGKMLSLDSLLTQIATDNDKVEEKKKTKKGEKAQEEDQKPREKKVLRVSVDKHKKKPVTKPPATKTTTTTTSKKV